MISGPARNSELKDRQGCDSLAVSQHVQMMQTTHAPTESTWKFRTNSLVYDSPVSTGIGPIRQTIQIMPVTGKNCHRTGPAEMLRISQYSLRSIYTTLSTSELPLCTRLLITVLLFTVPQAISAFARWSTHLRRSSSDKPPTMDKRRSACALSVLRYFREIRISAWCSAVGRMSAVGDVNQFRISKRSTYSRSLLGCQHVPGGPVPVAKLAPASRRPAWRPRDGPSNCQDAPTIISFLPEPSG
jgi:hypothetical protein